MLLKLKKKIFYLILCSRPFEAVCTWSTMAFYARCIRFEFHNIGFRICADEAVKEHFGFIKIQLIHR